MKEEEKKTVKSKIKAEIEKTQKLIQEYRDLSKPIEPENAIGRISRMDAINNRSISEAALKKSEKKLTDLKFMLMQINDENFGNCRKCRKPIPLGRLMLMPQSSLCVNCSR